MAKEDRVLMPFNADRWMVEAIQNIKEIHGMNASEFCRRALAAALKAYNDTGDLPPRT